MRRMQTPYFLGEGITTALGDDAASCVDALRKSPSLPAEVNCEIADQVVSIPCYWLKSFPLEMGEQRMYRVLDRVIEQALDEADLTTKQRRGTTLFIGSSSFDIAVMEQRYRTELITEGANAVALRNCGIGNLAVYIQQRFRLHGEDFSFNTACTASANALMYAAQMIRCGQIEHALVVGIELFNEITALGFHGLELLTDAPMKPFDRARNGLILGEGCAALVLGSKRPNEAAFYFKGGANLCDTHSITAANSNGYSIALVIEQALQNAGIDSGDINALKVHGTASLLNDEAEAAGIRRIFNPVPTLCALKPYIGHTFGACGLNELILFYRALQAGFLVATPGICAQDSDLGVRLNQHCSSAQPGHYMLNYFGFGGSNTSLVISNHDE
jgi:3-oxoacyl-[acyl-carrier-protein] synthase I